MRTALVSLEHWPCRGWGPTNRVLGPVDQGPVGRRDCGPPELRPKDHSVNGWEALAGMPTTERAAGCRCRILLSDTTRARDRSRCVEPPGEMVSRDGIEPSTRILRAVLENYIQIGEPPARCRFPPPYSHPHHSAQLGTV